MTRSLGWIAATISVINLLITSAVWSAVERIEVVERGPFAKGTEFGPTGAYERLKGRLHFAVDLNEPANRSVVDLKLAPRDERGLVTFSADFILLRPADLSRGNHRLLYEVNNRGNLGMLPMFNGARHSNDPVALADTGDGFLLHEGYSFAVERLELGCVPGQRSAPDRIADRITGRATDHRTVGSAVRGDPADGQCAFQWGFSRGQRCAISCPSSPNRAKIPGSHRAITRRGCRPGPWSTNAPAARRRAVQAPGPKRASSVHSTQREAEAQAKRTVANSGDGEVRIQGRDGKQRDFDTVPPGSDPRPPRDKKH